MPYLRLLIAGTAVAGFFGLGCQERSIEPDEVEDIAAVEQGLVEIGSDAIAYDYAHRDHMPHGIAGDTRFVFVTEPLHGRVAVLGRVTGFELGALPPPPGGFLLPFAM